MVLLGQAPGRQYPGEMECLPAHPDFAPKLEPQPPPPPLTDEQREELAWDLGWELHKYARLDQRDELAKLLKEGGAYCDAPDVFPDLDWQAEDDGSTALWWTCMHGDWRSAKLLIDAGAPLDTCDTDLWTAISVAARYGHHKCVKVLLDAGADPSIKVADGETAIQKAEFWEHSKCEELLHRGTSSHA